MRQARSKSTQLRESHKGADFLAERYALEEMFPHLHKTRNTRVYPDDAMLEKLAKAAIARMTALGEQIKRTDQDALLHCSTLPPLFD